MSPFFVRTTRPAHTHAHNTATTPDNAATMAIMFPMAAVITTPEIAASFNNGMEYFNTFGGNPVSCRVGCAVLDVIEREQLQENAHMTGSALLRAISARAETCAIIGDVRGMGLFIGIELVTDRQTKEPATAHASAIVESMKSDGVLMSIDGPLENVLKFKPPIGFRDEHAALFLRALDRALDSIA